MAPTAPPATHTGLRTGTALILAGLLTLLGLLSAAPVGAQEEACDLTTTEWTADAAVNATLTDKFTTYGDTKRWWSGGDGTWSVPLSETRSVWLFSDTFVGPVNHDGTQSLDTGFVNSSMVVEDEGKLVRTVTGREGAELTGLLAPEENGWYWLGASHLGNGGSSIDATFQFYERFGPGQWDWGWSHNVLGRFSPTSLRLQEVVQLPSGNGVSWASWIMSAGDDTYIYGVEDHGIIKYMHLARVAGDDLTATPWEFWDGSSWSSDETSSARIMSGVANEYSVSPFGDGYLLVTHNTNELFSAEILGYVSCSPTGPFVEAATLYRTPETGPFGSYGNPNIITYNAHEHPELRDGSTLLVTYNVNSLDWTELYDDVTIYRPRFVDVTLIPME